MKHIILILPLALFLQVDQLYSKEKAGKKPDLSANLDQVKENKKKTGAKTPINILQGIPYSEKSFGKRKLLDEKYLQLMQMALLPGQALPKHLANSNVHILVLEGEIIAGLNGVDTILRKGDLQSVAYKTSMFIRNESKEKASFTVWKTPNPSEMK